MFHLELSIIEKRIFHNAVQIFIILHIVPLYHHGTLCYALEISGHAGRNPLRL